MVPMPTSPAQARRGATSVPIAPGMGGLRQGSVALCHQVTTLDRGKLTKLLGRLPDDVLVAVGEGLNIAQDLR